MVMAANEDVTRRRRSAHDQRRMQGARGQRGHLRQRCSGHSRRRHRENGNPLSWLELTFDKGLLIVVGPIGIGTTRRGTGAAAGAT
jgi:hypothetical protein